MRSVAKLPDNAQAQAIVRTIRDAFICLRLHDLRHLLQLTFLHLSTHYRSISPRVDDRMRRRVNDLRHVPSVENSHEARETESPTSYRTARGDLAFVWARIAARNRAFWRNAQQLDAFASRDVDR